MPSQGCFPQLSLCPCWSVQRVLNLTALLLFSSLGGGKCTTSHTHCLLLPAAGRCLNYTSRAVYLLLSVMQVPPCQRHLKPHVDNSLEWKSGTHLKEPVCFSARPWTGHLFFLSCKRFSSRATWIWICHLSTLCTCSRVITWCWGMK